MGFSDSRPGAGKKNIGMGASGLRPEVMAAISASLNVAMGGDSAEMVAAVSAAIIHAVGGGKAVRFKKSGNAWAAFGRQKIMDSRQML